MGFILKIHSKDMNNDYTSTYLFCSYFACRLVESLYYQVIISGTMRIKNNKLTDKSLAIDVTKRVWGITLSYLLCFAGLVILLKIGNLRALKIKFSNLESSNFEFQKLNFLISKVNFLILKANFFNFESYFF